MTEPVNTKQISTVVGIIKQVRKDKLAEKKLEHKNPYDSTNQVELVYKHIVNKMNLDNADNNGDNTVTNEVNLQTLKQNVTNFRQIRQEIKELSKQISSAFLKNLDIDKFPMLKNIGFNNLHMGSNSEVGGLNIQEVDNSLATSNEDMTPQPRENNMITDLIKLIIHTNVLHSNTLGAMGSVTTGSDALLKMLDRKIEELEGEVFVHRAFLFSKATNELRGKSQELIDGMGKVLKTHLQYVINPSSSLYNNDGQLGAILNEIKGDEHFDYIAGKLIEFCQLEDELDTTTNNKANVQPDNANAGAVQKTSPELENARLKIESTVNKKFLIESAKSNDVKCKNAEKFIQKLRSITPDSFKYTTADGALTIEDLFSAEELNQGIATNAYFTKTKYLGKDKVKIVNPRKTTINTENLKDIKEKISATIYSCGSFYGKFTKDIYGRKLDTESKNSDKKIFLKDSAKVFIKKMVEDYKSKNQAVKERDIFDVRFLALVINTRATASQRPQFKEHQKAMKEGLNAAKRDALNGVGGYYSFGLNVGNNKNQISATSGLNKKSIARLQTKLDEISNSGKQLSIAKKFACDKLKELIKDGGDRLTERHNAPLFLSCLTILEEDLNIILMCGCLHAKDRTSAVLLTSKVITHLACSATDIGELNKCFDKGLYASNELNNLKYEQIVDSFVDDLKLLWYVNGTSCGVWTNVNPRAAISFLTHNSWLTWLTHISLWITWFTHNNDHIIQKHYFDDVMPVSVGG